MATAVKPLRLDGRRSAANVEVCADGGRHQRTRPGAPDLPRARSWGAPRVGREPSDASRLACEAGREEGRGRDARLTAPSPRARRLTPRRRRTIERECRAPEVQDSRERPRREAGPRYSAGRAPRGCGRFLPSMIKRQLARGWSQPSGRTRSTGGITDARGLSDSSAVR